MFLSIFCFVVSFRSSLIIVLLYVVDDDDDDDDGYGASSTPQKKITQMGVCRFFVKEQDGYAGGYICEL